MRFSIYVVVALLCISPSLIANTAIQKPQIIIILDDLGYRQNDIAAFSLPVEVAFSVLPQSPLGNKFARLAHKQGRDVMLHLPMASLSDKKLGPSALTINMRRKDIEEILDKALVSVPYVVGVNNHMGSALTTQAEPMGDLMLALKKHGLFFVDSRTTPFSVAYKTAISMGVKADQRHVFLDHEQSDEFYQRQFTQLIAIAKKYGRAIGIAHPYPSSIEFLSTALKNLEKQPVRLSSVSRYFGVNSFKKFQRTEVGLTATLEE